MMMVASPTSGAGGLLYEPRRRLGVLLRRHVAGGARGPRGGDGAWGNHGEHMEPEEDMGMDGVRLQTNMAMVKMDENGPWT